MSGKADCAQGVHRKCRKGSGRLPVVSALAVVGRTKLAVADRTHAEMR